MPNVTIRGLDGKGKVFTIEVSIFGQQTEEARPLIGDKSTDAVVYLINALSAALIPTTAQRPSERATRDTVNGPP